MTRRERLIAALNLTIGREAARKDGTLRVTGDAEDRHAMLVRIADELIPHLWEID